MTRRIEYIVPERINKSETVSSYPYNSIPIDILRIILDHLNKADLVTICLLNKVCCSCAQDVLYRDVKSSSHKSYRTLSTSPHLARRVRMFSFSIYDLIPISKLGMSFNYVN